MLPKPLTIKVQMVKIIFLLIICLWHPLYVVKAEAISSQKPNLPSLTILFDTTNLDRNVARNAATKIVEELSVNTDIVIHNYTLVPFNEDLKYQPIITPDLNSTKAEIQKMKIKSSVFSKAEPLYVIEKCLSESHPPNPLIIVITDSKPGESPSVSEVVSAINTTKTRIIFLLSTVKISLIDRYPNTKLTEIATASQGQIFTYETNAGIRQALQFIYKIMNATTNVTVEEVPGGWSEWSGWTPCNQAASALYGADQCLCSARQCNNPPPKNGGAFCHGVYMRIINCTIHGGWTEWSEWSSCNSSCGEGAVKTRSRTCTNPAPAYGGKVCSGQENEVAFCTDNPPCPTSATGPINLAESTSPAISTTIIKN